MPGPLQIGRLRIWLGQECEDAAGKEHVVRSLLAGTAGASCNVQAAEQQSVLVGKARGLVVTTDCQKCSCEASAHRLATCRALAVNSVAKETCMRCQKLIELA